MQLSSDEIQVIATAIIWRLYQVESAPKANLTDDDWQILRILLHDLIDQKQVCVFGDQQSVELDPQFSALSLPYRRNENAPRVFHVAARFTRPVHRHISTLPRRNRSAIRTLIFLCQVDGGETGVRGLRRSKLRAGNDVQQSEVNHEAVSFDAFVKEFAFVETPVSKIRITQGGST
ncbi:hypothetical protein [Blastopirellula marina]|uniref:hypothetical protein n=1 Tax=Blastopirellula marina TaxID=124 RepID=UPI0011B0DDF5|nr:hypothetical protein [Blastopirellula marina]